MEKLIFPRLDWMRIRSRNVSQIYIVACGSAYHVGMAAQYVFEDLARIPVRVELASEFRYRNPILDQKTALRSLSVSPVRQQTALRHSANVKPEGSVHLLL